MEKDRLRQKITDCARRHKASWIELGQCLYQVFKDKFYKNWGYLSFQAYCKKELGLKEATAAKIMKSYHFLEEEEPRIISANFSKELALPNIPNFDTVNVLRQAKSNQNLTEEDYGDLRQTVFNSSKEPKEVRSQVKKMIESRDSRLPEEIERSKRNSIVRRLMTALMSAKRDLEGERLLPSYLLKQMNDLRTKLEDQLEDA